MLIRKKEILWRGERGRTGTRRWCTETSEGDATHLLLIHIVENNNKLLTKPVYGNCGER